MNIITQSFNNYNNYTAPCFKAIPLAKYSFLKEQRKAITVFKLEKTDIEFLKYVSEHIDTFYKKHEIEDESPRQVVKEAIDASIEILQRKEADILLATADSVPSAILIGNTLKKDKNGNFHYSSRKNHSKYETELDWLATWNKKFPGEGKATVYEYFYTLLNDGFKQCFVRSELPEKSSAVKFYTNMGFEKLSEKPRSILRKNDNRYVIGSFDDNTDKIIPMKATVMDFINTIKEKADMVMRKEIKNAQPRSLPKEHLN